MGRRLEQQSDLSLGSWCVSGAGWCVVLGCECEGRVVSVFGDPSDSEMSPGWRRVTKC